MPEIAPALSRNKKMSQFSKVAIAGLIALTAVAAIGAPVKTTWLLTFTSTDKGSHIIGNPAAPKKLVEYMSYTCGHCADFENNDAPLLKAEYIATGKASLEIRNYVLNSVDLTAAMLARCGGKGRFFGNHKHLLATQDTWLGQADKISAATDAKLQAQDYAGYMTGVYVETGLSAIMQQRGITLAEGKACLADKAAFEAVVAMSNDGEQLGVRGTPTFMINGELQDHIHDFQTLKPKLD